MPAGAEIEKEILEVYLAEAASTKPKKLWIALCEEEQTRNLESKTLKKELAYTGYERKEIKVEAASATFEFVAGTEAEPAVAKNKAAIEFPKNTGADEKDAAKFFAIVGAAKSTEAGKLFFFGKLEKELKIQPTLTKIEFEAKKLEITCE